MIYNFDLLNYNFYLYKCNLDKIYKMIIFIKKIWNFSLIKTMKQHNFYSKYYLTLKQNILVNIKYFFYDYMKYLIIN